MNGALEWTAHWVRWSPTLEDMKYSIPRWAKWFFPEDVKDAFEHVIVAEADRHMMTVVPPI